MTFDELKAAGFVEHHLCGGCGGPVGYMVHPEMAAAVFQSGCDCGGTYPKYRLLTHGELADVRAAAEAPQDDPLSTEFRIEAGRLYRTAGGAMALVGADIGGGGYPFHGTVVGHGNINWARDGRHLRSHGSPHDIVAEWAAMDPAAV